MTQQKSIKSSKITLFEKEILLKEIQIMDVLSVRHVAAMLGRNPYHIYRLSNQGKIPSEKKNGSLFFLKVKLLDWINQGAA